MANKQLKFISKYVNIEHSYLAEKIGQGTEFEHMKRFVEGTGTWAYVDNHGRFTATLWEILKKPGGV